MRTILKNTMTALSTLALPVMLVVGAAFWTFRR